MLSLRKKYKISIDYSDFNIHDAKRYFNGMTELEFTGKELQNQLLPVVCHIFFLLQKFLYQGKKKLSTKLIC